MKEPDASPAGITTGDIIAIQRFFLGMTTGTGNVGKYSFTPSSRSYSLLFSDQTGRITMRSSSVTLLFHSRYLDLFFVI